MSPFLPLLAVVGPLLAQGGADEMITSGLGDTTSFIADSTSAIAVLGLAVATYGIWQGKKDGKYVGGLVIGIGIIMFLMGLVGVVTSVLVFGESFHAQWWAPPITLILGFDLMLVQNARSAPEGRAKRKAWEKGDEQGMAGAFGGGKEDKPKLKAFLNSAPAQDDHRRRHKKKKKARRHISLADQPEEVAAPVDPNARLNRIITAMGGPAPEVAPARMDDPDAMLDEPSIERPTVAAAQPDPQREPELQPLVDAEDLTDIQLIQRVDPKMLFTLLERDPNLFGIRADAWTPEAQVELMERWFHVRVDYPQLSRLMKLQRAIRGKTAHPAAPSA